MLCGNLDLNTAPLQDADNCRLQISGEKNIQAESDTEKSKLWGEKKWIQGK